MGGTYWLRGGGAQSLPLEGRQRRQRTVPTPRVRGLFDSTVAQIEAEKMHARLYFGTAPLFAFSGGGTSTKTRSRKRLPPKVEKSAKLPPKVERALIFLSSGAMRPAQQVPTRRCGGRAGGSLIQIERASVSGFFTAITPRRGGWGFSLVWVRVPHTPLVSSGA